MKRHPCRHCPRSYETSTALTLHMRGHHNPTRIEQALAFGRTDGWIRDNLHATDADIDEARERIYAADKETG